MRRQVARRVVTPRRASTMFKAGAITGGVARARAPVAVPVVSEVRPEPVPEPIKWTGVISPTSTARQVQPVASPAMAAKWAVLGPTAPRTAIEPVVRRPRPGKYIRVSERYFYRTPPQPVSSYNRELPAVQPFTYQHRGQLVTYDLSPEQLSGLLDPITKALKKVATTVKKVVRTKAFKYAAIGTVAFFAAPAIAGAVKSFALKHGLTMTAAKAALQRGAQKLGATVLSTEAVPTQPGSVLDAQGRVIDLEQLMTLGATDTPVYAAPPGAQAQPMTAGFQITPAMAIGVAGAGLALALLARR